MTLLPWCRAIITGCCCCCCFCCKIVFVSVSVVVVVVVGISGGAKGENCGDFCI